MTTPPYNTPVFPPEIWLQISWHLDLPDLDSLATSTPLLTSLTQDPALHRSHTIIITKAIRQFNASVTLQQTRIRAKLSTLLRTPRTLARATLYPRIIPDIEASSHRIARALLPALHSLNSHIRRHALVSAISSTTRDLSWFEGKGRELGVAGESARLAVCPSVKKSIRVWEDRFVRMRHEE
ncbi:hypothetical protein FRC07_002754 [Ceratobasidium sp. 392]|nr:hypothetical protein FRC07_002754 [Ceratobasidium sp. 392]